MAPEARKAAWITGGSGALGRSIALRLAEDGWKVGLFARDPGRLEEAERAIGYWGGEARGFAADVLDRGGLVRAFERAAQWSGRCDALICAAGQLRSVGPMAQVDPETWWRDLEVGVRGLQQAASLAVPSLRASGGGSIVALVGAGAHTDLAYSAGYGAGQAALVRLVECLAIELKSENIPVYALNPGMVPTPLLHHLIDTPEGRKWLPRFNAAMAEGKEVTAEPAAEMAAWLVSERPAELSGRVVSALLPPELLATRLGRIVDEDLGRLRLTN
ncbi:MAG: SDR family oxidoreductase [Isosphaeraceae bacterium]